MLRAASSVMPVGVDGVLKALGSEVRRRILGELYARGRLRYSELMHAVGIKQSGWFAHHLKLLLSAGLVKRDGEGRYYLSSLGRRAVLLVEGVERSGGVSIRVMESMLRMTPLDEVKATWGLITLVYAISLATLGGWLKLLSLALGLASLLLYASLGMSLRSLYCLPLFLNIYWVPIKPARWKPTLVSMVCGISSALAFLSSLSWRLKLPLGFGLLAIAASASYLGYRSAVRSVR